MVMRKKNKTLSVAATHLAQALNAQIRGESGWADGIERALTTVEQAIRQQETVLDSPDDNLIDVGSDQESSAGLDRKVHHLHEDLAGFLAEVRVLRGELQQEEGRSGEDRDGLRRRAVAILGDLSRYEKDEARLILETANNDLGAGD